MVKTPRTRNGCKNSVFFRKGWGSKGFGGRRPPQDLPRQNGKILGRRPRLPMLFLVFRGYMVSKMRVLPSDLISLVWERKLYLQPKG